LRQATLARAFDVDVQEIGRRGPEAMYPHLNISRRHLAACTCRSTASAIPPTSPWRWPRARGCRTVRIIEGVKVTAVTSDGKACHRCRLGAGRRDRHDRRRHRHQLRRHVGPRSCRAIGRHAAAACLRAFLHRHRTDRGPGRAAGAAGAGRMRLLQGRRRQDDARRLRAGAKPWGMDGIPEDFEFDQLPEDFEHFEPILEMAATGCRCSPRRAFTPSSTGPKASRRMTAITSAKRRRSKATGSRPGYNSIGIVSSGGAGMALAQWIDDGEPPFDLWEVDIRRAQPFQRNRHTCGTRHRNARPALRRSLPLPADRHGARRAPLARCMST
jgi:hypothetical protein